MLADLANVWKDPGVTPFVERPALHRACCQHHAAVSPVLPVAAVSDASRVVFTMEVAGDFLPFWNHQSPDWLHG